MNAETRPQGEQGAPVREPPRPDLRPSCPPSSQTAALATEGTGSTEGDARAGPASPSSRRPTCGLAAPLAAFLCAAAAATALAVLAFSGEAERDGVLVESIPAGASVFVDGELRGLTPCRVAIGPGPHALRLEKAGFEAAIRTVDPEREAGRLPVLELERASAGKIALRSKPPGAEVFLDGQFRGVSPLELDGVSVGPHVLRVEKTNHGPKTLTVLVRSGETANVYCELEDRMLEFLKNAVAEFPEEIYRYMELGHYYFLSGEPELAAETYGRGLAIAQLGEGDRTQREKLERQVRKDMSQGGPVSDRFRSHMERIMRGLHAQQPKKVSAALQEAQEHERAGRAGAAAEVLERASREFPENAALREELARLRLSLGEKAPALAALREAFRRSGADHGTRQRLAEAALAAGSRYDEQSRREIAQFCAEELARTRVDAPPDQMGPSWKLQYRLELEAGRQREAATALATAAGLERDTLQRARMEIELAKLYASTGRIEEARRLLQKTASGASEPSLREAARAELDKLPR